MFLTGPSRIGKMARRKLKEYLDDPSLLRSISEEEMRAWAAEVPYAGLVQRLLAIWVLLLIVRRWRRGGVALSQVHLTDHAVHVPVVCLVDHSYLSPLDVAIEHSHDLLLATFVDHAGLNWVFVAQYFLQSS